MTRAASPGAAPPATMTAPPPPPEAGPRPAREVLVEATRVLREAGVPSPALDAGLLLADLLGVAREALVLDPTLPVSRDLQTQLEERLSARAQRLPVAYLLGRKGFHELELAVGPGCLVPRPDSECVLEAALARIPADGEGWRVVDVGTGSGCLAASLAAARPRARVLAADLSAQALGWASRNHPGACVQGDLLAWAQDASLDLVISNPPYLDREAGGDPELAHEPALALYAEDRGLAVLRRLVPEARRVLRPGGHLLVEHGAEQGPATREMARAAGLVEVRTGQDLAGRDRFLAARAPATGSP